MCIRDSLRIVFARSWSLLKAGKAPINYADNVKELNESGLLIWENFLSEENFQNIYREANSLLASEMRRNFHHHGTTIVEQVPLEENVLCLNPVMQSFLMDPRIKSIVGAVEKSGLPKLEGFKAVERVRFGNEPKTDEESVLHSDIYFNTHKAWLYLDDVEVENGPLVVVPRSHRIDWTRLKYEYFESVTKNRGSRRISGAEGMDRGLEEKYLCVPANTLVIANTHGYHRRSPGRPRSERKSIQITFRYQPFIADKLYKNLRNGMGR